MRILIAEDQPEIAAAMARMVTLAGHEPQLAADGHEAVRMAANVPPDIVLLDVQLPGIDGYETALRLRRRRKTQFPIFAVTGSPMDVPRAQRSGFDGIFSKPFDQNKLTALLRQLSSDNAQTVLVEGSDHA